MESETVPQCSSYPAPEVYFDEDDETECRRRLFRLAVMREIVATCNPYLTKETAVVRALQKMALSAGVSWNSILADQAVRTCVLDDETHREILDLWEMRKEEGSATTLDEQQCVERVLGRDRVRPADLQKLAQVLYKNADSRREKAVWKLFAVDGFRTNDPKNYAVDTFKYRRSGESSGGEDAKCLHVRAVGLLYRNGCDDPKKVQDVVERAWSQQEEEEDTHEWVRMYREVLKDDRTLLRRAMEWRHQPTSKESSVRPGEGEVAAAERVKGAASSTSTKRKRATEKKKKVTSSDAEPIRHFESVGKKEKGHNNEGRKRQKRIVEEEEEEEVIEQLLSEDEELDGSENQDV